LDSKYFLSQKLTTEMTNFELHGFEGKAIIRQNTTWEVASLIGTDRFSLSNTSDNFILGIKNWNQRLGEKNTMSQSQKRTWKITNVNLYFKSHEHQFFLLSNVE
jgi:hypothetical protein